MSSALPNASSTVQGETNAVGSEDAASEDASCTSLVDTVLSVCLQVDIFG